MKPKVIYEFDQFSLDPEERFCLREGVRLDLTPKALAMLFVFAESGGRLVTKRELLEKVWAGIHVDDHNLRVTVGMLRKALGRDHSGNPYIETVPKEGYRFLATVSLKTLDPAPQEAMQPQEAFQPPTGSRCGQGEQGYPPPPGAARSEVSGRRKRVPDYILVAAGTVALAAVLLFLGSLFRVPASRVPSRVSFTTNLLQASDERGRVLWTYRFPKPLDLEFEFDKDILSRFVRIEDLLGDGKKEVLVALPFRTGPNPGDADLTELDCFSSDGTLIWSYVPQKTFRFGSYDLGGPWSPFDVFVSQKGTPHSVWVTYGHREWGNSFVVELDPATGKDTLRFVNTGSIYMLNEITTSKGSYLFAGGFNNEYAAGSLAVIDERRPFATSPQTEGTRHKCVSCPEGTPDYYFVFPRSEINRLFNLWEDSLRGVAVSGEELEISKAETAHAGFDVHSSARAIYLFHTEPAIQPFAFRFDSEYDMLHQKLEKERKLDHSLESCPERLHPEPVRMWTPSAGWTEVRLNPARSID